MKPTKLIAAASVLAIVGFTAYGALATSVDGDAFTSGNDATSLLARAGDAVDGLRINFGKNDLKYPAELYAEKDFFEIYADATGAAITMASSAAVQVLGNTNGVGDLANSVTANGFTVDLDAGTATVANTGIYRCHASGRVTGEEDEDVTLEWQLAGSNIGEPAEMVIEFDATGGVAALGQQVHMEFIDSFTAGQTIALGVLGSNNEVITFSRFNFGCEQIKSGTF